MNATPADLPPPIEMPLRRPPSMKLDPVIVLPRKPGQKLQLAFPYCFAFKQVPGLLEDIAEAAMNCMRFGDGELERKYRAYKIREQFFSDLALLYSNVRYPRSQPVIELRDAPMIEVVHSPLAREEV